MIEVIIYIVISIGFMIWMSVVSYDKRVEASAKEAYAQRDLEAKEEYLSRMDADYYMSLLDENLNAIDQDKYDEYIASQR